MTPLNIAIWPQSQCDSHSSNRFCTR